MKISPAQRWALLSLAAFASLAAAAWVGQASEPGDSPVPAVARPAGSAPADARGGTAGLPPVPGVPERMEIREASRDLFAGKSWYVPPPPSAQTVPTAPTAPPLPFKYLGRMQEEGGRPVVYLVEGDQLRIVGAGDVIGGRYRVESVEGNQVVFTYLPLNVKQPLAMGGPS